MSKRKVKRRLYNNSGVPVRFDSGWETAKDIILSYVARLGVWSVITPKEDTVSNGGGEQNADLWDDLEGEDFPELSGAMWDDLDIDAGPTCVGGGGGCSVDVIWVRVLPVQENALIEAGIGGETLGFAADSDAVPLTVTVGSYLSLFDSVFRIRRFIPWGFMDGVDRSILVLLLCERVEHEVS